MDKSRQESIDGRCQSATTLALLGGGTGLGLGLLGTYGIAVGAGWQTLIGADAVVVAIGFAGAVGIGFGFYSAWRAVRLNPIETLRRQTVLPLIRLHVLAYVYLATAPFRRKYQRAPRGERNRL